MKQQTRFWRPPVLRVIFVALAVAAAPLPSLAGETPATATSRPSLTASVEKIAASEAQALARSSTARAQQTAPIADREAKLGSGSFFKSTAGIITLVAVGAGLGFALYSTSHDRVKSPNVPFGGVE